MHEDGGNAELVGDGAGVLAARPAEAVEHVPRDVVSALDRNLPDCVGHVVHGDAAESGGDVDRIAVVARMFVDMAG